MSNLVARRTFYGRPCPNHDLSWLCVVGDARSTAVAALTWVLWKGRNRLQNLEATSQIFYGPDSVPNIRKTFGGTPAYRFQIFWTLDFFWKKARLKRPFILLDCSSWWKIYVCRPPHTSRFLFLISSSSSAQMLRCECWKNRRISSWNSLLLSSFCTATWT